LIGFFSFVSNSIFYLFVVLNDVSNKTKDLKQARQLLGQLLHTLQDFYSHSNWIELGKKEINERLGIDENIGPVAAPDQSTCTSNGCIAKKVKCVRNKINKLLFIYLFVLFKEFSTKNNFK